MAKKDLHPQWFSTKVFCDGKVILEVGGTKPELQVDIWSGNHPYYQGITTSVVTDEGRVNKFKRRFAGLDSLSAVNTMASLKKDADDAAAASKK